MRFKKKDKEVRCDGVALFADVQEAVAAEKLLSGSGYHVKLIAPPPELRKGCDLAVGLNLVEQPGISRVLQEGNSEFLGIEPLNTATSSILEIVKTTDFGDWIMVKAGNMKLTFRKSDGIIVNTSGGGCPDIPWLHTSVLYQRLDQAPLPSDIGYTLCALMLQRALEEALILWKEVEP